MQILLLFWYNFEAGERSCDWTARGVLLCFIYICGIDNILLYLQSLWNAIEDDDKCAFPLHLVFPYISSGSQLFSMISFIQSANKYLLSIYSMQSTWNSCDYFFTMINEFLFYGSTGDLQCVSSRCTAQCFSYTYIVVIIYQSLMT